jgi:acyl-CoA synthetase (AMP-forming)/AMP-acid ligase II
MYHGTAGVVFVGCMMSGITLCIGKKFSATKFWDDIRDSDSTAFVYVGEAARYLLTQPPSPRDKDHRVHLMFGNGLRPDVWKKFQDRFGITTVAEFFNSSEGVFGTLNVVRGKHPKLFTVTDYQVLICNPLSATMDSFYELGSEICTQQPQLTLTPAT